MSNAGYIDVSLIPEQTAEIIEALLLSGIVLPKHNPHCTLMYDKRDLDEPLAEIYPEKVFTANIVGIEVLGTGLIFNLVSHGLMEEHKRLKGEGYVHSFDSFLPHMSMSYDFDDYDVITARKVFADWGGRTLTFSNQSFGSK